MLGLQFKDLVPMLQVAIGPVILISGVGLILLSLTNRFGRAVDRSRQLRHEMREASDSELRRLSSQVNVLFQRARWIRFAIIMATLSVLLAAVLIILLFLSALIGIELGILISVLFMACMASLIAALLAFLWDIHLSLMALEMELGRKKPR